MTFSAAARALADRHVIMKTFHVITLFPETIEAYLGESILARAIENKKIKVKFYNPRDFTKDKHNKVDDKPYGGGPGMVMSVDPIIRAWQKAKGKKDVKTIIFSPSGKKLDTKKAKSLSKEKKEIVLICGRYEGIDARVKKITKAEEISIGDYVLTGGEIPAMVLIDTVSRQIEGVLGKIDSLEENRISSSEVYTRPEIYEHKGKKYKVPKVLTSGDHKKIDEYRSK